MFLWVYIVLGNRDGYLKYSYTLEMEATGSSEALVPIYQTGSSHSPEDLLYFLKIGMQVKFGMKVLNGIE
jgi:hypothetical protein